MRTTLDNIYWAVKNLWGSLAQPPSGSPHLSSFSKAVIGWIRPVKLLLIEFLQVILRLIYGQCTDLVDCFLDRRMKMTVIEVNTNTELLTQLLRHDLRHMQGVDEQLSIFHTVMEWTVDSIILFDNFCPTSYNESVYAWTVLEHRALRDVALGGHGVRESYRY